MQVKVTIAEGYMEGSYGAEVASVFATCQRCGHETESYGTGEKSVNRCLALLREECPRNQYNFYVEDEDSPSRDPFPPSGNHTKPPKPNDKPPPAKPTHFKLQKRTDGSIHVKPEKDSLWLELVDGAGNKQRLLLDIYEVTQLLLALKTSAIKARR